MLSPERRALRIRLLSSVSLMLCVWAVGTLGYFLLWRAQGGTVMDAVYMTVITMTTIGYGEVHPLDTAGRLLTMGVALGGIGSLGYALGVMMEYFVGAELQGNGRRKRMQKSIDQMTGHTIIAGFGRVGREAAREMKEGGGNFVVVDPSPGAQQVAEELGYPFVPGDSTADEVLERAGVRRARGLIVTADSDATNMYVVMSARLLNPGLQIVSRAVEEASVPKLVRAGANQAINPYAIGGRRLAHLILSPAAVDFFETALTRGRASLGIEDVVVAADSPACNARLDALALPATGATLLALVRDGAPMVQPPGDLALRQGDHLLMLGTNEQLQSVADKLGTRR